ncbi:MAG: hypothetical protein ACQEXJ_01790 [Myxococcota bacterium]
MNRLLLMIAASTLLFAGACSDDGGDGGGPDADVSSDVPVDGDVSPDDGPDAPDGACTPQEIVSCGIGTSGGLVGADADEVVLYPDDEPSQYLGFPALQFDVEADTACVGAGTLATLTIRGQQVGQQSVLGLEGDAGRARFTAMTFPPSDEGGYEVCVEVPTGDGAASCCKTVTMATEACDVALQPPSAEGCLTEDVDPDTPGFQTSLTVVHEGGSCDRASLTTSFDDVEETHGPVDLDEDGTATFEVTVGNDQDGSGVLQATAAALHPESEGLDGTLNAAYTVDASAPELAITQPTEDDSPITLGMDHNDDPADGLQYDVRGEVSGLGGDPDALVSLFVDGTLVEQVPHQGGVFVFEDVTFTQSGPVTLTASAEDPCGNVGESMVIVDVFGVAPDVAITAPSSGGILNAVGDQDTSTAAVYERDFEVEAAGVVEGTAITVQCRPQGADTPFVPVGEIEVGEAPEDDVYAVPVALDVGGLGNEVECRAAVAGPNPSMSAVIFLTVGLPAPSIDLASPEDGARLADALVTFVGEASGLDGRPIDIRVFSEQGELLCSLQEGVVDEGAFTVSVDLDAACEGLADGSYFLQVDGEDVYGNVVSDVAGKSPEVLVTVDTTPPSVVRVSPSAGVLDPVADPAHADTDPTTPGYQQNFVFRLQGETEADGAEICVAVNGADLGCEPVADTSFEATWTGVTLDPGDNTVEATAVDAFGNAAAPLVQTVDVVLDAPIVRILEPAPNTVTTESTVAVVAEVVDPNSGDAITGASTSLLIDGEGSGLTGIDGGDGTYTFSGVPLEADVEVGLQVVAVVAGEEGASAVRSVTWKTSVPGVSVVDLPPGDVLNLSSDACLGTQKDCHLSVEVATTDAEDGSTAGLDVTCDGVTETFEEEVSDGSAVFGDIALLHGFTCDVTPSVVDLAGQEVAGDTVSIRVDRVAPSIVFKAPAVSELLNSDDANPGTPDVMDHALSVTVSGVEEGQEITVVFEWEDPDLGAQSKTFTATVPQDVPEGESLTVTFENETGGSTVVYPTGTVTLSASLSDTAGNEASTTRTVVVEPQSPKARIIFPSFLGEEGCSVDDPCPEDGVCSSGQCWHPWGLDATKQLSVNVAGLITSQDNVRVCSDHPDLAVDGIECQSEGYHRVALASVTGDNVFIDVNNLPQGFQALIAEALPEEGGAWVSSLEESDASGRLRRVLVDDVPPEVEGIAFPGDTDAPQDVLSISEQASPAGDYKVRVSSNEDGMATLFTNNKELATAPLDEGLALFQVVLDEGENTVHAVVKDAAGNESPEPPDTVQVQVLVDRERPTLAFANPDASPVVAGDILDVILGSDKDGGQVTLFDAGVEVGTEMVVDGQAVFPHAEYGTLADGTHTLTAEIEGPNGNGNTAQTSPAEILVDTTPPEAVIASPAEGTTFADADDADPEAPGFQVDVDFSVGSGTTSWSLLIASGCDAAYTGCGTGTEVASGTVSDPAGADLTRTVTVPLTESLSHKRIVVEATDDVGNVGTGSAGVTFDIADCVAGFTDLVGGTWYNGSFCADGVSCSEATVQVTAQFFACGDVDEIRFLDDSTVIDSTTDVGADGAVFDLPLQDGDVLDLELKLFSGGVEVGSSGVQTRKVDFTPPDVSFTATDVAGFITPSEGAEEVYNLEADASASLAGFQGHVAVLITDANAKGGSLLSATATTNGTETDLTPSNVTLPSSLTQASPVQRSLRDLTYPDQETSVVTVAASDAAGNEGVASFTAEVDIVPPAAVELNPIGEADVDPRLPSVALEWSAVGDNGTDDGFAEAYDIRYSRNPIDTADQFEAACPVTDLAHTEPLPEPVSAGLSQGYAVTGPDPRPLNVKVDGQRCKFAPSLDGETFHFAVRAVDDAGNWSDVTGASVASTTLVETDVARVRFGPGFVSAVGGDFTDSDRNFMTVYAPVIGDVNGDGAQDVAVGHQIPNAFCVVFGDLSDDLVIESLEGPTHRCVVGADTVTGDGTAKQLGSWIDSVGDVNGDGLADFGVSGKIGSKGFVAVYLGVQDAGPDLANPNLIIAGADASSAAYSDFCGAGNFTGDLNGDVPVDDIAVGEQGLDLLRVIPGDPAWTSDTQLFWDLDVPEDLTASGAFTIEADFDEPIQFGSRCKPAGDILPTPGGGAETTDELLVLQSVALDRRLFVIPGRSFSGGETVTLTPLDGSPTPEDQIGVRLRQEAAGIGDGFAQSIVGTEDVTGDGVADVVLTQSGRSDGKGVYVFDGAAIQSGAGGDLRIQASGDTVSGSWVGANGFIANAEPTGLHSAVAVVGNFDGWLFGDVSTPDLVYAVGGDTTAESVQFRANHETDEGASFLGLYPFADALYTNPFQSGTFSLGTSVDGGVDLDGDGLPDIVLGTAKGEILLIR